MIRKANWLINHRQGVLMIRQSYDRVSAYTFELRPPSSTTETGIEF